MACHGYVGYVRAGEECRMDADSCEKDAAFEAEALEGGTSGSKACNGGVADRYVT